MYAADVYNTAGSVYRIVQPSFHYWCRQTQFRTGWLVLRVVVDDRRRKFPVFLDKLGRSRNFSCFLTSCVDQEIRRPYVTMFIRTRYVTSSRERCKYQNSGNTNRYTIQHSMYALYYLAATCFDTVAIFRELAPGFHWNVHQYVIVIMPKHVGAKYQKEYLDCGIVHLLVLPVLYIVLPVLYIVVYKMLSYFHFSICA